jgi:hypothetical protein
MARKEIEQTDDVNLHIEKNGSISKLPISKAEPWKL